MRNLTDRTGATPAATERIQLLDVRKASLITIVAAGLLCSSPAALVALSPTWSNLSAIFLDRQDKWLLLGAFGLLAACWFRLRGGARAIDCPAFAPWMTAVGLVCFCFAGHYWILDGYAMSRDEQMAVFDASILATGRLAQPLPQLWQAHADALNLLFMLPVSHPVAWVSAYLPMNAALRALVGFAADPALTGPLMTGLGLVFLWNCACRLWPQEREAAVVALLLYVGSGQILFAGMTAYAMPAHLALDLLWLWLFLMRRPWADLAALAVAFVATGLHQPLFHPLFALPFLVGLFYDRAWGRLTLYGIGYATITAVWMCWPILIHGLVAGPGAQAAPGTDYVSRLVEAVFYGDATRWADMAGNLLRFAAWQPILLLPLMAAGLMLAGRARSTRELAASVALPMLVMAIILPYQGHGFGYRYLHGVLGPAILLAIQGWRALSQRDERWRPLLVRTTIAGLLVLLPLQAVMAHAFYAPFARIDAVLRGSDADYAIVGSSDAPFARDLVINRPDLSNRPIRLLAEKIDDALLKAICRPGVRVAMSTNALFASIDAYFGIGSNGAADGRFERLSASLKTAGCRCERISSRLLPN